MSGTSIAGWLCGVAALCVWAAQAGNVCTWQGGSGKFSDANWDTAPVSGNGDTIVFGTTNGTAITVENDLADDFALAKLMTCSGTDWKSFGKITLTGKRLYFNQVSDWTATVLQSGATSNSETDRGAKLQFDTPLRFTGGRLQLGNETTFNGAITVDDEARWALGWTGRMTSDKPAIIFNAALGAPNATLDITPGNGGHGSRVDINVALACRELYCNGGYFIGKPTLNFNAAANAIGTFHFRYNYYIHFKAANALLPTTVLNDLANVEEKTGLHLWADQTVDRLQMAPGGSLVNAAWIQADKASTLTMKATTNVTVASSFLGPLSLVWDPQGDYAFTLDYDGVPDCTSYKHTNTLSGAICVQRGVFNVTNGVYFTALTKIAVASGATFSLAGNTHADPIPESTVYEIADGGHLEIPAGRTLRAQAVRIAGAPLLERKVYTKDNCTWITGDGAFDYRPYMKSYSGSGDAMKETCWNKVTDWTNTLLQASVAPNDAGAAAFDYFVERGLRTPQNGGRYTWHCNRLTLGAVGGSTGHFYDCCYYSPATNVVENEGLELAHGALYFMSGRFGHSTWLGKITILSPEGDQRFAVGHEGQVNADQKQEAQMIFAGTLHGAAGTGFRTGGGEAGTKFILEADASDFYGTLTTHGATGWTTLGGIVFNGTVVCKAGSAFGAETAQDAPQVKALSIAEATPFIVPVDAAAESAACLTVTNAFTQAAPVTVYRTGRMWHGWTPILKLAPACTGTLDLSNFSYGGVLTKRLAPVTDEQLTYPQDMELRVQTEADGTRVLYLVSLPKGTTLIVR